MSCDLAEIRYETRRKLRIANVVVILIFLYRVIYVLVCRHLGVNETRYCRYQLFTPESNYCFVRVRTFQYSEF